MKSFTVRMSELEYSTLAKLAQKRGESINKTIAGLLYQNSILSSLEQSTSAQIDRLADTILAKLSIMGKPEVESNSSTSELNEFNRLFSIAMKELNTINLSIIDSNSLKAKFNKAKSALITE